MQKNNNSANINVATPNMATTTEEQLQSLIPPNVVTVEMVEDVLRLVISRLDLNRAAAKVLGPRCSMADVFSTVAHELNVSLGVCEHCGKYVGDRDKLVRMGEYHYCPDCMELPAKVLLEARRQWSVMMGYDVE